MMSASKKRQAPLPVWVLLLVIAPIISMTGACSQAAPATPAPSAKQVTPLPTAVRVSARLIPHPIAGREECLLCHSEGELYAMPADHEGRDNDTCTVCHDLQPSPPRPAAGSAAEQGQTIWQERVGLSCRQCHGYEGRGAFGPPLADTSLDFDTFRQRTRAPLSERMPPIATAPDDPVFEQSGTWISDEELRLVYAWLTGVEPAPVAPAPESTALSIPHNLQGQEDCLSCHGADKPMPFPANHEGWGNESCLNCHEAQ